MFSHRERMLEFIERWNVAPRLHKQAVSSHSFYVSLYADCICRLLDLPPAQHAAILGDALRHDCAEIVLSDIPGPVKRSLIDPASLALFEQEVRSKLGDEYEESGEPLSHLIIKCADIADAYYYLCIEVSRGNKMLEDELKTARERLFLAVRNLTTEAGPEAAKIFSMIQTEATKLFYPVELAPRLDTDLE